MRLAKYTSNIFPKPEDHTLTNQARLRSTAILGVERQQWIIGVDLGRRGRVSAITRIADVVLQHRK